MWADNDTDIDLLGFRIHSELIQSVVTRKTMLPVTVGLFGDWGSGKSSVMRMLQKNLENQDKVSCISFNGWQFEGYDDAKTALIQSILEELKQNQDFGHKIKDKAEKLIKRVNWFRLLNMGYQTFIAPVISSYISTSVGLPPTPFSPNKAPIENFNLDDIVNNSPANIILQNVREFQKEFNELIKETQLEALIVLIDDIDRCSPERLVDTLEAIKLFLAVPCVGFVIGADIRLVRYSIATRYKMIEDDEFTTTKRTDLVTDYIEKLIQIPYYLPHLAPNELETYVNLLFCQLSLDNSEWEIVLGACDKGRKQKKASVFGYSEIASALNEIVPERLEKQIALSQTISVSLADILKGNPRQTKRLLNSLLIRLQLAEIAGIQIESEILIKLMVLEYIRNDLFMELYNLQARQAGTPKEISDMEKASHSSGDMPEDMLLNSAWKEEVAQNWLRMQPSLSQVDLRDYFWLTRDRLSDILAGVSLISPIIRTLIGDIKEIEGIATTPKFLEQIHILHAEEQSILFRELGNLLKRNPHNSILFENWVEMGIKFPEAAKLLLSFFEQSPTHNLPSNVAIRLSLIHQRVPELKESIERLFKKWKSNSKLKILVEDAEKSLRGS